MPAATRRKSAPKPQGSHSSLSPLVGSPGSTLLGEHIPMRQASVHLHSHLAVQKFHRKRYLFSAHCSHEAVPLAEVDLHDIWQLSLCWSIRGTRSIKGRATEADAATGVAPQAVDGSRTRLRPRVEADQQLALLPQCQPHHPPLRLWLRRRLRSASCTAGRSRTAARGVMKPRCRGWSSAIAKLRVRRRPHAEDPTARCIAATSATRAPEQIVQRARGRLQGALRPGSAATS
mmetsp:Transcript_14284/g.38748  ORF Transcript_14284/g.38748 Transcript_14284/m.38748 type:complete len:232 (+) Transcript_14284:197-892(+)